ncbi:MAG TPA: hypothetical protein VG777_05895 [Thermoanaerobaculia bacterium]|nr:hypothetical protein [Thermoanaerobaculia bacterium]
MASKVEAVSGTRYLRSPIFWTMMISAPILWALVIYLLYLSAKILLPGAP